MEESIIEKLYEKKEDDDLFEFENDEITSWRKKQKISSEELFSYIEKRVHPKSQAKLNNLIERYLNSCVEEYCGVNKMYYQAGVSDGIQIMVESLKK